MKTSQLKIIVNDKDFKKYKINFSMSGLVIDELAYASGQWTEDMLYNNNYDYAHESFGYINEHFDFEAELLKATKTMAKVLKLSSILGRNQWSGRDIEEINGQKLQAGAYIALTYPEAWAHMLNEYESQCQENASQYNDDDFIHEFAPGYQKELAESVEFFWENLTREWLRGDRNSIGVVNEIGKYWEAEAVEYSHKKGDCFIFFFDIEKATDDLQEYNGTVANAKNYKSYLLGQILGSAEAREYKEKAEREKRQTERKELAIYKEGQAKTAEAERKAKLLKLKK